MLWLDKLGGYLSKQEAMSFVLIVVVLTLCALEVNNFLRSNGSYAPSQLFSTVVGIVIGYYFQRKVGKGDEE
jgi:hypothetical protein